MRIVVVGAGAMGSLVAARLALAEADVALYGRPSLHLQRVAAEGLTLEGIDGGARNVRLELTSDPAVATGAAVLVVLVKTWATSAALLPLRHHLVRSTAVLTLQNGLGNVAAIREALCDGRRDVLVGITTQAALRPEPGRVRHTGDGPFVIGREYGLMDEPLTAIVEVFSRAGLPARAVPDIERWIWNKLAINAAINSLTALAGAPNRAIVTDPDLRSVATTLAREVEAVAAARGLAIGDGVAAVMEVAEATGPNRSSMLRDLETGRPTEIEAINGAVVKEAARLGLSVPANELITGLIRARERRSRERAEEDEGA